MRYRNSDSFFLPEFAQQYPLDSIAETRLLKEAEYLSMLGNTTVDSPTSSKGTVFGLGLISALLLFSGMQLYRSVNVNLAKSENASLQKTFLLKKKTVGGTIFTRKLTKGKDYQKPSVSISATEMLGIKNAIAHGKF